MSNDSSREPMLEMFIFETMQLIDQLEQIILYCEKSNQFDASSIDEVFRIMHTIKGSAAMMLYNNIATLAHSIEDLFYFVRQSSDKSYSFSNLNDIVLEGIDFIKQ